MDRWARRARQVTRRIRLNPIGPAHSPSAAETGPVPAAPLPQGRYLFVVGTIPPSFGGRTASILTKCRLLKEVCGVSSTIVTLNYSSELADVPADLRRRGLLVEGVTIVNLHDYFERDARPTGEVVRHEVDEPGMATVQDPDQQGFRYFENGVQRLYKRFDDLGRLLVREWFDENEVRTRRDEFGANGLVRRTIHLDLRHHLPREEVFYRSDGTPCMTKRLVVDLGARRARVDQVTLLDRKGRPVKVLESNAALKQLYLDTLIG